MRRSLWIATVALGACKGPPPQSVTLDTQEVFTSTDPVLIAVKVRDAAGVSAVDKGPFDVSLTPIEVADVDKAGTLTCKKTGDAKLSISIQGVAGTAQIRCRLVDHLDLDKPELIDVTKGSFSLRVRAVAKDGSEVPDVPITITPSKATPLKIKGVELTPVEVGETELTVRAGSAEQKFTTKIVRSLTLEALPMQAGHRINFSLPEGKFELRVTLKSPHPLAIEWRGAPYCDYKGPPAALHTSTCVLENKGGVVTDNPRFVDSGSTAVSRDGIELFEVP